MKIIITETQYKILVENTQLDLFFDNDDENDILDDKDDVTYSFLTMSPWVNPNNSKDVRIYFNKGKKISGELETGYGYQLVNIIVGGKTYKTTSGDFMNKFNKYYVGLKDFIKLNPGVERVLFPEKEISSQEIRESLEMAFPSTNNIKNGKWFFEDDDFTAGVRGIYKIGDRIDTDESWSILNYFDTKTEIKIKINQEYASSKSNDEMKYWLVDKLRDKNSFIKELVDRQWQSIKSGFETEKLAEKIIGADNATFYPPGSKMDRINGVDMTYNGVNYQIKPLISYSTSDDGVYTINTYGMKDYKSYPKVNRILFVNNTEKMEFENGRDKKYITNYSSATFYYPPINVDKIE